jgi:signal transduction histidine kinase
MRRGAALFRERLEANYKLTDRMFARLMVFQWLAGIAAAVWISPRAWEGQYSHTHVHVWAAIFLGGMISGFPVFMAVMRPGAVLTRHVIAVGQMLSCGLFIHLTGGRIESHFQYFGCLAFLAFYRDWRVLLTATVIAGADHFVRGVFWPQSIFGVLDASWWRWIEHAGWVVFEDIFLVLSMRQNLREMRGVSERQAILENMHEIVERTVEERTRELRREIAERKKAQAEVEDMHKQFLDVSRRSGMAEIASNILHNVGNVLNSVNISTGLIVDRVKKSKGSQLAKLAALLEEHAHELGDFFSRDPRGKTVPRYLTQLSELLLEEQATSIGELDSLRRNVEHIKEIVAMQQSYATVGGVKEMINVVDLVEDAIRINEGGLRRHGVDLVREFQNVQPINVEKHKILQIVVNLLSNAKHACDESTAAEKRMTVCVTNGNERVTISVADNGIGIPPENMTRIFNHGFTTRKDGHGFGLHSGALAAREMGGSLTVQSEGHGQGAKFVLELPCLASGENK